MLEDIIDSYINKSNVIITSASGGGSTSLCLYLANILSKTKTVIYYNIMDNIERSFVRNYYRNTYKNVIFISAKLNILIKFLTYINYEIDHLIIDPADMLISNPNIIPTLTKLLPNKLICTSQIRQNPAEGGKVYSTIEYKYSNYFNTSIWIRKVTEPHNVFVRKYIDIYKNKRIGNNFEARYIANYTKEGNIIA